MCKNTSEKEHHLFYVNVFLSILVSAPCSSCKAIFAESVLDGSTSMGVFLAIISVISSLVETGFVAVLSRKKHLMFWRQRIKKGFNMF